MSYEPDDDRVTRGVGAVAAADKVSPGRYRRRIETGIATRKRDRAMAAVAAGALSGTLWSGVAKQVAMASYVKERDHRAVNKAPVDPNAPPPAAQPTSPATPPTGPSGRPPTIVPPTPPPTATSTGSPPASASTGTGPSTQGTIVRPGVSVFTPLQITSSDALGPQTDNTTRNIAIAGGAVLAAYLLFFRRTA